MIGLFGGTFNPIHNGHLQLAQQLLQAYPLQRIDFVPCHVPVHRDQPQVNPDQRKQMVELAVQGYPKLSVNSLELERGGPSYTFDTLCDISQQQPGQILCWLMGVDSFNSLSQWKNPRGILELAHLIVCSRPGVHDIDQHWQSHFIEQGDDLGHYRAGKIAFFQMQPNHCSSTAIRQQLKNAQPVDGCLAQPVVNFIKQNHLYES